MTSWWVAGLAMAVLAVGWVAFRALRHTRELEKVTETDIPLWDADEHTQRDFWPELIEQGEDTAPAVLTPPEWREPTSVSGGDQRRFFGE